MPAIPALPPFLFLSCWRDKGRMEGGERYRKGVHEWERKEEEKERMKRNEMAEKRREWRISRKGMYG